MATEYFIETENNNFKDKNYKPNIFPNTWFVQTPIDEEHKYWKLMAYLQRIDNNVNKGYLFQEYYTLEKRYKDLHSFIATYDIVHKDKDSEKLFNYIYDLPDSSLELNEIDKIVSRSINILKKKYLELTMAICFLKDDITIVRKDIRDNRKKINVYIEMCNCGIIEHYTLTKKGVVELVGSFESETKFIEDNINNIIEIKTNRAFNVYGIIIPYLMKFSLSKNQKPVRYSVI